MVACSSSKKKEPIVEPTVVVQKGLSEVVLIDEGESSQASYSPFGNKILFVSRLRKGHNQAQVYEKDLTTGRERRLTFQNGDLRWPRLHTQERILLYASPTDELKENPPMLQEQLKAVKVPAPYADPYEIYLHNLDTLEMTRLTRRPGFDGEPKFSFDGRQIFWTRQRLNVTEIIGSNLQGQAHVVARLGKNPTQYTSSPDGQIQAWVEWNEDFSMSQLRVRQGKDLREIADPTAMKMDLEFSRDGRWLLWAQSKSANGPFELWTYDVENQCTRSAVVPDLNDRRYPTLSPDLQWLTYTLIKNKKPVIARTTFVQPTGPCRETN